MQHWLIVVSYPLFVMETRRSERLDKPPPVGPVTWPSEKVTELWKVCTRLGVALVPWQQSWSRLHRQLSWIVSNAGHLAQVFFKGDSKYTDVLGVAWPMRTDGLAEVPASEGRVVNRDDVTRA